MLGRVTTNNQLPVIARNTLWKLTQDLKHLKLEMANVSAQVSNLARDVDRLPESDCSRAIVGITTDSKAGLENASLSATSAPLKANGQVTNDGY